MVHHTISLDITSHQCSVKCGHPLLMSNMWKLLFFRRLSRIIVLLPYFIQSGPQQSPSATAIKHRLRLQDGQSFDMKGAGRCSASHQSLSIQFRQSSLCAMMKNSHEVVGANLYTLCRYFKNLLLPLRFILKGHLVYIKY